MVTSYKNKGVHSTPKYINMQFGCVTMMYFEHLKVGNINKGIEC